MSSASQTRLSATSKPVAGDVAWEGLTDGAYDEEAFRYFLELEQRRARRAGRTFLLMLVELFKPVGGVKGFEPHVAKEVISGLSACLREGDLIGWYSEGWVAGAILTEHADRAGREVSVVREVSDVIGERIMRRLREALPSSVVDELRVHVHQLPGESTSVITARS